MLPIDVAEVVKKYGGVLGKGFIAELAPKVIKGTLLEVLKQKGTNVKRATKWIEGDICLWDTLEPKHQKALIALKRRIGSVDWLTAVWVIGAIRVDMPAVASLFLGWKKGHNWLERQVGIIKTRMEG